MLCGCFKHFWRASETYFFLDLLQPLRVGGFRVLLPFPRHPLMHIIRLSLYKQFGCRLNVAKQAESHILKVSLLLDLDCLLSYIQQQRQNVDLLFDFLLACHVGLWCIGVHEVIMDCRGTPIVRCQRVLPARFPIACTVIS